MTGPEQAQLNVVAAIVTRIETKLDGVDGRVDVIEKALAFQRGADGADARNAERRTSESRWRKGVAVSLILSGLGITVSIVLGILNLYHVTM